MRISVSNAACHRAKRKPDGAIVLRQAAVLPVEIYSDARLAEFEREGTVSDMEAAAATALLKARKP